MTTTVTVTPDAVVTTPAVPPQVPGTERSDAIAVGRNWIERAYDNASQAAKKAWNTVGSWFSWLGRKIASAARWVADKARALGRWVAAQARGAVAGAKSFGAWLGTVAAWTRDNSVAMAKGVWTVTAPFRGWVATPFRLAFGTSAGLAALLILGGKVVLLVALPWVIYLLMSGRLAMVDKKTATVVTTGTNGTNGTTDGERTEQEQLDALVLVKPNPLNDTQKDALGLRKIEIESKVEEFIAKANKTMTSEYIGRMYLVQRRMAGSLDSAEDLVVIHKRDWEEHYRKSGPEVVWTAIKRGILAEDKLVKAQMDMISKAQQKGQLDGSLAEAAVAPAPQPPTDSVS